MVDENFIEGGKNRETTSTAHEVFLWQVVTVLILVPIIFCDMVITETLHDFFV